MVSNFSTAVNFKNVTQLPLAVQVVVIQNARRRFIYSIYLFFFFRFYIAHVLFCDLLHKIFKENPISRS